MIGSWQIIRDLTLKILEWLTGQPKRDHKISTKMTMKALGILKERGEVKIKPKIVLLLNIKTESLRFKN